MIFIVVKWKIRPEHSDNWLELTADFTEATRAEAGNLFYEWNRNADDPTVFTLVEAFADGDAGAAHVQSAHFKAAMEWMPDYVAATPQIVNVEIPGATGWSEMAEVSPRS
ncbi:putative quinol monooxygenase [Streptomyces sp. NPDC001982]|uniref:putative quinol monooxygenase n=1 Tax=unclassified Streptomyces TaxID=2593676 RepID=UPI00331F5E99